jgi:hypothetical protein
MSSDSSTSSSPEHITRIHSSWTIGAGWSLKVADLGTRKAGMRAVWSQSGSISQISITEPHPTESPSILIRTTSNKIWEVSHTNYIVPTDVVLYINQVTNNTHFEPFYCKSYQIFMLHTHVLSDLRIRHTCSCGAHTYAHMIVNCIFTCRFERQR